MSALVRLQFVKSGNAAVYLTNPGNESITFGRGSIDLSLQFSVVFLHAVNLTHCLGNVSHILALGLDRVKLGSHVFEFFFLGPHGLGHGVIGSDQFVQFLLESLAVGFIRIPLLRCISQFSFFVCKKLIGLSKGCFGSITCLNFCVKGLIILVGEKATSKHNDNGCD